MDIILMAISGHFINGYWWLKYHRLLVGIGDYSISDYYWLSYCRPSMVILLMAIGGYWWLFLVILDYITTIDGYYIISYCWIF
jgi:hypothetical protein